MNSAALIFVATIANVFLLGFNSRNINTGQYLTAAITSSLIGLTNLILFKKLPVVTTFLEGAGYCLGGSIGITLAMYIHSRAFKKKDL